MPLYRTIVVTDSGWESLMTGQRYFSPRRRFWYMLPATAFMTFWLYMGGRSLANVWLQKGTVAPIPAVMVLGGIFILVSVWRKRPPLTCQGCNAVGWPKDLDRNNPVCPLCGHSQFLASGRYRDGTSACFGVVLGVEIVSGAFCVNASDGGDCGDGGGDCGGGDGGGGD